MEGPAMKFGERIKELRTQKGLTLDQLAQETGSSKSYIWELENKNPPRPSAEKLSAIAGALGVTVDYLFGADTQTLSEAEDTAFFRQYSGLPEETRRQLREMARILDTKTRK
ncbi:transcriptional regulator with XRE-family HTH domain [Bradyrhizobium sp. S3.9.1]